MLVSVCFFVKLQEPKENDNVRVAVRCRPLNEKEKQTNYKVAVHVSWLMLELIIDYLFYLVYYI